MDVQLNNNYDTWVMMEDIKYSLKRYIIQTNNYLCPSIRYKWSLNEITWALID